MKFTREWDTNIYDSVGEVVERYVEERVDVYSGGQLEHLRSRVEAIVHLLGVICSNLPEEAQAQIAVDLGFTVKEY